MKLELATTVLQPEHCDPLFLLRELGLQHDYCALLESVDRNHSTNDFSFLALGARDVITIDDGNVHGSSVVPDGPVRDVLEPFQQFITHDDTNEYGLRMGYIGFLTYESARQFDQIDLMPDTSLPDAQFVLPEALLRIDHEAREVTLVSHADTSLDLDHISNVIHSSPFCNDDKDRLDRIESGIPLPTLEEIESYRQTSRQEHCARISKAQERIRDGEVFQVVLSQELKIPMSATADRVYEQLRIINPSPYMYYFHTPDRTIVGASPETLVRVQQRNILYRPIAGTRKRTGDPAADTRMQAELLADEKERCEHQMLVDLGRNDVGRVAEVGSVEVKDSFHIEQYSHVYHIVSDVYAKLCDDLTSLDALRSTFPIGTLSGAPKLRAMEIIRDLEKSPRGIYGGAFGYIDESGNLDMAIVIRTMLFQDDEIRMRVGSGIVLDSVPEYEDNECLHKARSCLAAITLAQS